MTPKPKPIRIAAHLCRLGWRDGTYPTIDAARADLFGALKGTHHSTWTVEAVYDAWEYIYERACAQIEAGERMHGQHPAQEP